MSTQQELDLEARLADMERQLAEMAAKVNPLYSGGMDRYIHSGYVQWDGVDMRFDNSGQQVRMSGGGASKAAFFFVKDFWHNADSSGRYRGDPQVEISANYNGTTTNQLRIESYLTRDALLSGPVSAIYLTNISGTSAEVKLQADYNQDGNAAELRIREDSSGNFVYEVHRGNGVYSAIGGGLKTSGGGYYLIPAGPSIGTVVTSSASADTYGSWTQMRAASGNALYIVGVEVRAAPNDSITYTQVDLGTGGAGAETSVSEVKVIAHRAISSTRTYGAFKVELPYPIPVAASTRIAVRTADNVASALNHEITLHVIDQADVVSI